MLDLRRGGFWIHSCAILNNICRSRWTDRDEFFRELHNRGDVGRNWFKSYESSLARRCTLLTGGGALFVSRQSKTQPHSQLARATALSRATDSNHGSIVFQLVHMRGTHQPRSSFKGPILMNLFAHFTIVGPNYLGR